MSSHEALIREWASTVRERLCRLAVGQLMEMPSVHAGDDSGLSSVWDEVCVQLQHEQSFLWDYYESVMHESIERALHRCTALELRAMWLQTGATSEWSLQDRSNSDVPVAVGEVHDWAYEALEQLALRDSRRAVKQYIRRRER